jgi:hypothetical protein
MPFMFMLIGAEIGLDNHLKRQARLAAGERKLGPMKPQRAVLGTA